jgi:RNA polymerase sigma-70 factor (ECF subfamily)
MEKSTDEIIPTRVSLIKRLKDWRDDSSWQDFFDTYWKLVYGVARKSGLTESEAEDAVQETIFSVAKHIPTFQYDPSIGSFKSWLLKMAVWRIKDQFRKRGRMQPAGQTTIDSTNTVLEQNQCSLDFEKVWDAEWENNLLQSALAKTRRRVEPLHYQIFDFSVNKEWPAEKIAQFFSVKVDQVYLIKHRVKTVVEEEIRRLNQEIV